MDWKPLEFTSVLICFPSRRLQISLHNLPHNVLHLKGMLCKIKTSPHSTFVRNRFLGPQCKLLQITQKIKQTRFQRKHQTRRTRLRDVLMDAAPRQCLVVYFSHNFNQIRTSYTITWNTVFKLLVSASKGQQSWVRISSSLYQFNDQKAPSFPVKISYKQSITIPCFIVNSTHKHHVNLKHQWLHSKAQINTLSTASNFI